MTRTTSAAGIALIQSFESFSSIAYPDPGSPLGKACTFHGLPMREYTKVIDHTLLAGNPWTKGWGHTGEDTKRGDVIDRAQAQILLANDLHMSEQYVTFYVGADKWSQEQFDAMVSLVFNIGGHAFGNSHLCQALHTAPLNLALVKDHWLSWNHAGGIVLAGLTKRRLAEYTLFVKGIST